jgi:hypothetical protein
MSQLYGSLCDHIKNMADSPSGMKAGFMEREVRQANEWPKRLSNAAATSRVFLPLYSRQFARRRVAPAEAIATLTRSGALTSVGDRFIARMRVTVEPWRAEPVPAAAATAAQRLALARREAQ